MGCQELDSLQNYIREIGTRSKLASREMMGASLLARNRSLVSISSEILKFKSKILEANNYDLSKSKNLSSSMIDRLTLNASGIESLAAAVLSVSSLPDPIGNVEGMRQQPSGIKVGKMRVPIGVVGMIYEARPSVTADVAALTIKSGNAALLKGGVEAAETNSVLMEAILTGINQVGLIPCDCVQLVDPTDRKIVEKLIQADTFVDLLIPRGGKSLIKLVLEKATMPVLKHLDGVCHVFVDKSADLKKALAISMNAKTQRLGTCNTMETLLVSTEIASKFIPLILSQLERVGIEIRACSETSKLYPNCILATEEDWYEEYLGPVLSVRIVKDADDAISHITKYGSNHTDSIVSEDYSTISKFIRQVDSSSVIVNASTRFADGFEYGLGAEIGISTDKFHARGPVGLEGLTSAKWIVFGNGEVRK
ncbi:glutamate-5-semialdehyde dehydrogenase [Pseudomonadota bacterium]|nr:glutamate-5-semialdehyde dehydrogenase [Pseudomonadota bacterium]